MFRHKRASAGFTLIELLVVIAIIAILAAILFPVFARARENARKSTCQSNLKQVGTALAMYIQDFDQQWPKAWPYANDQAHIQGSPGHPGWISNALAPYEKNHEIYFCPSGRNGSFAQWRGQTAGATAQYVSYCYNYQAVNGASESSINETATLAVMWDSANSWADCGARDTNCGIIVRDIAWFKAGDFVRGGRHMEGNNWLYADGHVKWAKWSAMKWGNIMNVPQTDGYYNMSAMQ